MPDASSPYPTLWCRGSEDEEGAGSNFHAASAVNEGCVSGLSPVCHNDRSQVSAPILNKHCVIAHSMCICTKSRKNGLVRGCATQSVVVMPAI